MHAEDQVHPRIFEAAWVDELFDHARLTPAPLGETQPLWLDTLIEPLARRWAMRKVPQVSSFEITHLHVPTRGRAWVHARFEPPLTKRELAYATDIMDPFAALLPAYVVVTVTWAHLAMLSALLLGPSAYRYSRRYGA